MLLEQNVSKSTYHVEKYHLPESFTFTWHIWIVLIVLSLYERTSSVLFMYLFSMESVHQVRMWSDVKVRRVHKFLCVKCVTQAVFGGC